MMMWQTNNTFHTCKNLTNGSGGKKSRNVVIENRTIRLSKYGTGNKDVQVKTKTQCDYTDMLTLVVHPSRF